MPSSTPISGVILPMTRLTLFVFALILASFVAGESFAQGPSVEL